MTADRRIGPPWASCGGNGGPPPGGDGDPAAGSGDPSPRNEDPAARGGAPRAGSRDPSIRDGDPGIAVVNRPQRGSGRWTVSDRRGERGSVTAELAVAMPVLVLLLFTGLAAVNAVATKLRCVDAAREAARAQARGDRGVAAGRRAAPDGAVVTVDGDGEVVRATVRAVVHPLGGRLPGLGIEAYAVAAREPDPVP